MCVCVCVRVVVWAAFFFFFFSNDDTIFYFSMLDPAEKIDSMVIRSRQPIM